MPRLTAAPADVRPTRGHVTGAARPATVTNGWIPGQRRELDTAAAPASPTTMAPWVPAVRVGGGPRDMISGARLFAGLAALLVLTRRRAA